MRESSAVQTIHMMDHQNITDHLERQVAENPENALFSRQLVPDQWSDVTARVFRDDVLSVAKGLMASGVGIGDHVAIMAPTRYEWSLVDLAIWYAGAVSVPIYETSSPSQVAWILKDASVTFVVVGSDNHSGIVDTAMSRNGIETVSQVVTMDGDLDRLRAAGATITDAMVEDARAHAGMDDLSSIIYTSGTTGNPKGCLLTHRNFAELSLQALEHLNGQISRESSTLLFLPMAHMFARIVAVICLASGATLGHATDLKKIVDDFGTFHPTFILGVPRIFEKIYNAALLKAESGGKGKIFNAADTTAVEWSRAKARGRVPVFLNAKRALFGKLVYSKVIDRLGGRVEFALSGGSPLGKQLAHFYDGMGLTILEGYGLTETTGPVTISPMGKVRVGTVGQVLPGNEVRIADDGEVLSRGLCNFAGYWNRPDLEATTFDPDGWYPTGDLGSLDDDGYLTITGRKKELLVTANGKNVSPNQLEDVIRADALISHAVVVGDNRPYIAVLITLDTEILPQWIAQFGVAADTPWAEIIERDEVRDHVQKVIDRANESVSRAESIRRYRIIAEDFTIDSGHLTPSLKIRRPQVLRDFANDLEALYPG